MSLTSYQAAPPRVLRKAIIAYIKAGRNPFCDKIYDTAAAGNDLFLILIQTHAGID